MARVAASRQIGGGNRELCSVSRLDRVLHGLEFGIQELPRGSSGGYAIDLRRIGNEVLEILLDLEEVMTRQVPIRGSAGEDQFLMRPRLQSTDTNARR